MNLEPRLHAFRPDLADERLRGIVKSSRFERGKRARIRVGQARGSLEPRSSAPTETHFHYGEEVLVFEVADGYCWCQSSRDRYVAYVEEKNLSFGAIPQAIAWVDGMGCYAYAEPDLRSAALDFLPRRSRVHPSGTRRETRGTWYSETLDGTFVPERCLRPGLEPNRDIVENACRYLGVPYLWGGRSFLGIDCSALVQNAFEDAGIVVPRDSDLQQESIGESVVVSDWDELGRGDLVFFPGHVVIYCGDHMAVHADGGSMSVHREGLDALLKRSAVTPADVTVRRM